MVALSLCSASDSTQCDGNQPCSHCSSEDINECTYTVHSKITKDEMQCQIIHLQERDRASTYVLRALSSSIQTLGITKSVQSGEDIVTIARNIEKNSVFLPSAPQSRTCDACKFRRQHCDGSKPCRVCENRSFLCKYTDIPASQVNRPELFHEPMGLHEAESSGKRIKRLDSAQSSTLDTENIDRPLSPLVADASDTAKEPSFLSMSRSLNVMVCFSMIFCHQEEIC